ncbi:Carboxy-terminal domain (CTD) phosphatase [Coelomomyces lativittatus]|nr:Carboxy-terminal domain (CTD) phosphatase [Coelomomyces lativittatus]KAJ1510920.1 Carboxy-terminal domain (CTD) phosphatase [Coelomomyces lativittatus]
MESIQSVTLPVSEATVDSFFLSDGSLVKRGQQVLRYEHVILVTQWSQVERYATFYEVMITKEDEKTSVWKEEIRKHQGKDNKEIDALQKEYIQHLLKENQRVYLKVRDFVTSPFEGKLILKVVLKQKVKLGDPLFEVVEECGHSVQFSGMCAICGKDLSVADFHGPESYRAQIAMVHDSMGITVSRDVAQKMDMETAHRLRTEKKLSLILDLDQTLIHATADPTVGLWVDTTEKTGVFRFKLSDEPTEYFLKLRPGLHEFLSEIQMFYELHIYTMGTRLYANQVAKIIDPEKKLFKERVLSRNESGSMCILFDSPSHLHFPFPFFLFKFYKKN